MGKFQQALDFLSHRVTAKTRHGIHSPFVYQFLEEVVYSKSKIPNEKALLKLDQSLRSNQSTLNLTDLGAGSNVNPNKTRTIADISRNSGKQLKYRRLFYRMVDFFKPLNIIELGTSLGLSTLFLASPDPKIKVTSIEGCPETAKIAAQNFDSIGMRNITLQVGEFDSELPKILSEHQAIDMVFVDGNHREQPTLDYFEMCLTKAHGQTVFIFDDIYWSDGMKRAWSKIKGHSSVTVTLDFFDIGIAFLNTDLTKQNFRIRY